MISIGSSVIQFHAASAAASTGPSIEQHLCAATLSVSNNPYGCDYSPPEPRYSSLEVNIAAVAIAILIALAVRLASKKYFAKHNKKSSRLLLYAAALSVILLLVATILVPGPMNSAYDDSWFSKSSAEVLTVLVFVPSFAVSVTCLVKARQHKQHTFSVVGLLLAAATVCLTCISISHIIKLYPI